MYLYNKQALGKASLKLRIYLCLLNILLVIFTNIIIDLHKQ